MKYPKLLAVLGLQTINIHSGLFGSNSHARLDEEQLQKIDDQLSSVGGNEELQTKYDALQKSFNTLQSEKDGLQNAVAAALELNGLTDQLKEGDTDVQAVEILGTKCKEFATSNNRHSFQKHDGEPEPEGKEEDESKNYHHNRVMTSTFNFPKIKE